MMSLNFAICAVLLLSGAASPSRNAGQIKRRTGETRIVGGNVSFIENVPYMVSLEDSGNYFCGGSILNGCYVLTSAGCVVGVDPGALTVRGGSPYINESGNTYAVRSIVIHPKFSEEDLDYNVALVQTTAPMGFSETVQPIPLVEREPELAEYLTVAGWGELEEGGDYQHQIHYTTVQVVNKKKCASVYEGIFGFTDRMMCTFGEGRGSCHGDNGGPAVYNNRIAGVISHRIGCGQLPDIHISTADPGVREFIMSGTSGKCK